MSRNLDFHSIFSKDDSFDFKINAREKEKNKDKQLTIASKSAYVDFIDTFNNTPDYKLSHPLIDQATEPRSIGR